MPGLRDSPGGGRVRGQPDFPPRLAVWRYQETLPVLWPHVADVALPCGAGAAFGGGEMIPSCPDCGRIFQPGVSWPNANYCRAAYLLPQIERLPGLSTWELAQETGLDYADVSRALLKAREWGALLWDEEPREGGAGVRYRYRVAPDWRQVVERGLRCRVAVAA